MVGCDGYDATVYWECVEAVAAALDGVGWVWGVVVPSDWGFVGGVVGCVVGGWCLCAGSGGTVY